MIRIEQVRFEIKADGGAQPEQSEIRAKAASLLHIKTEDIAELSIARHSIDARKKPVLYHVYTVDVEVLSAGSENRACSGADTKEAGISGSGKKSSDRKRHKGPAAVSEEERILRTSHCRNAHIQEKTVYRFPYIADAVPDDSRPIVTGFGPAGMLCAYELALHGFRPVVIERGGDVDERTRKVEAFWNGGVLDTECNVQFGEGGAGTFSDGKLNTGVSDRHGMNEEALRVFVGHGAPEDILYEAHPHIGTDVLKKVVKNIRQDILSHGGEIMFHTKVDGLVIEDDRVRGVRLSNGRMIRGSAVILAIGHSARDTFLTLLGQNVRMEAKAFAVGLRIEHPQSLIDMAQYGRDRGVLPAAPYKLAMKTADGRSVYSFCMCPGGMVVNASSEEGRLCVNGMSLRARDGLMANSAIVAAVDPGEYGDGSPLSGMYFQRELEERAFRAGSGRIPAENYGSFRAAINGTPAVCRDMDAGSRMTPVSRIIAGSYDDRYTDRMDPVTCGAWTAGPVHEILPYGLGRAIVDGMEYFGTRIEGFNREDAVFLGVESRTSSPVRILRDERTESVNTRGLYPCGEGAGYAGGITSAAMDGIRVAEHVAAAITNQQ